MSETTVKPNTSNKEEIWELYTQSWAAVTRDEKLNLFRQSLAPSCTYNDPTALVKGHEILADHMLGFHQQIPKGHFVTTRFLSHNNKSIAHWDMKDADGETIGVGTSYGEYGDDGKLTSMTGFF